MKTFLYTGLKKIYHCFTKVACKVAPYSIGPYLAKIEYKRVTGERLNLKNPKNLIEKIVWLQFYSDTSLWTECADKYLVRKYVQAKGLSGILPKFYGAWENVDTINWIELPNKFVIKTNNSCGKNILIRDKQTMNIHSIKCNLKKWLKTSYGHHNAQLHYLRIKPRVIIEELIEDPSLKSGENIIDYKIVCLNGYPECIFVMTGRKGDEYYISVFDLQWNNITAQAIDKKSHHYGNQSIEKPKNLDVMLKFAQILSEGIAQVRVDFYNIGGKIYFGEMTFTTGYGYRTKSFSEYLGSKIDLSKIAKIR